jgi:HEAT repeat protein
MRLVTTLALALVIASPAFAKPDKDLEDKALTTLERGAKAGDFDVRALAVEGLGNGPKKRVLGPVKDALADPQWNVRGAAIIALRNLKEASWEKEVQKAVCEMPVDPEANVMPLVEPLGAGKAVPILVKGLEQKDCPRPERYVAAFVRKGGEWFVPAFKLGLKSPVKEVKAAFDAELPNLPLGAAMPLYKEGFAKYPPELQAALLKRIAAAPIEDAKDLSFTKGLQKSSKDAEIQFQLAYLLALRGDATGKATLLAALTDTNVARRVVALQALEHIADAEVFEAMKALIKDRETPYEQLVLAYRVYMRSGSTKLVSYLEGEIQNTDVPQRAAAVYFLGQVKGKAALQDLYPLLGNAPMTIRLAAAHAIGELGQRESVPVLRDTLSRETDKTMKLALLEALAAIKDVEIIPVARFYIADSDPDVRRLAVKAIIGVPDASSSADLEIASRDRMKDIREMAFFALIEQDPENRLMLFERSLEWLAPDALYTFVSKHGDKVKRHVVMALGSSRDDLRAQAWALTKRLGKPVQIEIATELAAKNERQYLRLAAIDRLVELQGKDAIPTLEAFAKDPDDKVRVAAIAWLGRLGHKPGIEALRQNLDDPSERVRVAVAGAILKL